jgi:hypothetical protein
MGDWIARAIQRPPGAAARGILRATLSAQQVRQLGDICRDPPRLIGRE